MKTYKSLLEEMKAAVSEYNEATIKEAQAVVGGKVHRYVTGHNITVFGKKYESVEFELLKLDNSTEEAVFSVLAPKEIFGKQLKVSYRALRRGPFTKTDTSKRMTK